MRHRIGILLILLISLYGLAQRENKSSGLVLAKGRLTAAGGGVFYADLVEGTGKVAERGKRVTVHYTGWLEDGTKIDSSIERGKPYQFVLGDEDVIRGWDVGIKGMRVGGKRQLRIPPSMAYGMNGRPPVVPPDARLVFEIELLDVEKK